MIQDDILGSNDMLVMSNSEFSKPRGKNNRVCLYCVIGIITAIVHCFTSTVIYLIGGLYRAIIHTIVENSY